MQIGASTELEQSGFAVDVLLTGSGCRSWLLCSDNPRLCPRHAHDEGKAMGRGLDHFRKEGAKLIPPPTADDPYEDEAYRLWTIKQRSK